MRSFKRVWGKDAPVLVVNDNRAGQSISDEYKKKLAELGCEVQDSDWERNGNLNGKATIVGQLKKMLYWAKKTNSDWVFKQDSDFLFLHPEHYSDLMVRKHSVAVFPSGGWLKPPLRPDGYGWGLGICYTIHVSILPEIIHYFEVRKTVCWGEDYEISTIIRRLYGEGVGYQFIQCDGVSIVGLTQYDKQRNREMTSEELHQYYDTGCKSIYFGNRDSYTRRFTRPRPGALQASINPNATYDVDPETGRFSLRNPNADLFLQAQDVIVDEEGVRRFYGTLMKEVNDYVDKCELVQAENATAKPKDYKEWRTPITDPYPEVADEKNAFEYVQH